MRAFTIARGWGVSVRVETMRGEKWFPVVGPLSYTAARVVAQQHANAGRRARLIDPDGNESADVPKQSAAVDGWRLTM